MIFDSAVIRDGGIADQVRDVGPPDRPGTFSDTASDLGLVPDSGVPDAPSAPDSGQPDVFVQTDQTNDRAIDAAAIDTAALDAAALIDAASAIDASLVDAPAADSQSQVDAQGEDSLSTPFCSNDTDGGVGKKICIDFSDPTAAAKFLPEGGTWAVSDGIYKAKGPDADVTCPAGSGSLMTASVLRDFSAKNVRVHAKMRSVKMADKVLVLRSHPGGNRIEINFRTDFVYDGAALGGDLYVCSLANCQLTVHQDVGTVSIHHPLGQAIVADVQLIGQQLTVAVDGRVVFDKSIPVPTDSGSVGLAVFLWSETEFDDFMVESLD
jgi:hypothetical protein